jgi:uncharacterized protein YcbX
MRVDRLYRYPVKGLSAEALDEVRVEAGGALPWDRAFALAQGGAPFDPEHPKWLPKTNFMCLRQNARIALLKSSFDARRGRLTILAPDGSAIEENALWPAGRERIGAWLAAYLGEEARGEPRFHYVPGHVFGDQPNPAVSLINQSSMADFERQVGARRHRRRFRANVWFSGAPAWAELEWVGRDLIVGGARLRVTKRITRCPATEVNPDTGERDAEPVRELHALYSHSDLGIHARVVEAGSIALGDAVEVLEAGED